MRSAAERQLPGWPEPAPLIRLTAIRRISVPRAVRSDIERPEFADSLQRALEVEAGELAEPVLRARPDERGRRADPQHFALQPPVGSERRYRAADSAVQYALLDR